MSDNDELRVDYTDIANRAQEITGRSIFPSTVEAVLKVAGHPIAALAPASGGEDAKDVHRVMDEGDGYWKPCSGCYESVEGYDNTAFPYSDTFRCRLGGGCNECGGLGAVWEQALSALDAAALLAATPTPQAAGVLGALRLLRAAIDESPQPDGYAGIAQAVDRWIAAANVGEPTPQAAGVSEERVERAWDVYYASLIASGPNNGNSREALRNAIEAVWPTAAGSAPEGFVLVPREPTPEMLAQMAECYDPTWGYPDRSVSAEWAARSYAAMLAATPTPPAAPQEGA